MYTRQQASLLKQAFWTAFGQYMSPVPGADGTKVHWINYKTGVRHIQFSLQAEQGRTRVAIELTHPDPAQQALFYQQFEALRTLLQESTGTNWQWALHSQDAYGKVTSLIYEEVSGLSVFNKADWPALISFFKEKIMGLDAFWHEARPIFEML